VQCKLLYTQQEYTVALSGSFSTLLTDEIVFDKIKHNG
jgi:hypothetical protein